MTALIITSNVSFAETDPSVNSNRVSSFKEIRGKTAVDQPEVAVQQLSQSALNSTPIITPTHRNISNSKITKEQNWQPPTPKHVVDARDLSPYSSQFDNIPDSALTLAYQHIEQRRYSVALKVLELAAVSEPYDSRIQYLMGMAYLLSNSYYSAITSFNRSIKLQHENINNPSTPISANNNLFGEGIATCTYYGRAMALTLSGNHARAYNETTFLIDFYTGASSPTAPLPPLLLGGKADTSCFYTLQKQVLELFPNGGLSSVSVNKIRPLNTSMQLALLYYFRSLILSNSKYFEAAVKDDQRAVALVPNEVSFQNHLAYNYMEAGEYRKAVDAQLAIIATYGGSAYNYNALSTSYILYGSLESDNHLFYQQKAKEASYNACYFYQDCTLYNSINNGDVFVQQLH